MMYKVINWFRENWKVIGLFVGIINIISGLGDVATGNVWIGLFWIFIGSFIVYDVRTSK